MVVVKHRSSIKPVIITVTGQDTLSQMAKTGFILTNGLSHHFHLLHIHISPTSSLAVINQTKKQE